MSFIELALRGGSIRGKSGEVWNVLMWWHAFLPLLGTSY
jgi:hypothetical protein